MTTHKLTSTITKKRIFTSIFILLNLVIIQAQTTENNKVLDHFSGNITITNNGISLIPSFTLGEPAAIVGVKMGKKRHSIEPEIRLSLEGKPWTFLVWWRYMAVQKEKFSLRVGAHPAMAFSTKEIIENNTTEEVIQVKRFIASEIAPNYKIVKNLNIGIHYLFAKGIDNSTKTTHFMALNSTVSNIKVSNKIVFSFTPQVFYLKMDNLDGFYTSANVNFTKKSSPFSIQANYSKQIKTDIDSKDNLWNVAFTYAF